MVIDMHCHLLPGVDDGSKDEKETEKMLRMAWKEGIRGILVTPHYHVDRSGDFSERCKKSYQKVCSMAKDIHPGMKIFLGNEIFYSAGVVEALKKGEALTLNGTRYVLVEFATYVELLTVRKAIQELQYAGYAPIVAHMERYDCLKKEEQVRELVEMGALMQVNASTLTGKMGMGVKRYMKKLLKEDLIHIVGTDAHSSRHRRPKMKKCLRYIQRKAGASKRRELTESNPATIIRGEDIFG